MNFEVIKSGMSENHGLIKLVERQSLISALLAGIFVLHWCCPPLCCPASDYLHIFTGLLKYVILSPVTLGKRFICKRIIWEQGSGAAITEDFLVVWIKKKIQVYEITRELRETKNFDEVSSDQVNRIHHPNHGSWGPNHRRKWPKHFRQKIHYHSRLWCCTGCTTWQQEEMVFSRKARCPLISSIESLALFHT